MSRPFQTVTGRIAVLDQDDIDSDQILPAAFMRGISPDFAAGFFALWRRDPEFVLNRPELQGAPILLTGRNFGCGSTREHAAWAVGAYGIRVLLAESFAEVFRDNCAKNGILALPLPKAAWQAMRVAAPGGEFTVDLAAQRITGPGGFALEFDIAPPERTALLEGLDDVGMTLKCADDIAAFEARERAARPWLQRMLDRTAPGHSDGSMSA